VHHHHQKQLEDDAKEEVQQALQDVVEQVVMTDMTEWIQDMANMVTPKTTEDFSPPETETGQSLEDMFPDSPVTGVHVAAACKDALGTQKEEAVIADSTIPSFEEPPQITLALDEPADGIVKEHLVNIQSGMLKSMSVRIHRGFFLIYMLLLASLLVACFLVYFASPRTLDVLCSPVPTTTVLGASSESHVSYSFEAPWWAPDGSEMSEKLFNWVCGASRPRIKLEWQLLKQRKGKDNLYRLLLVDLDHTTTKKNNKKSNGKVIVDRENLVELRLFPAEDMLAINGKHQQKIAAPWQAWNQQAVV
jgi:hypothetical protein